MIDILYVAKDRLAYTQASFQALTVNTDWRQVNRLYVVDDNSTDGTGDWLREAISRLTGVRTFFTSGRLGGPVAAMNWYLDRVGTDEEPGMFAKVDNDFVVCPGWVGDVVQVMRLNPLLDMAGIACQHGPPVPALASRELVAAEFIGGVGVIRRRVFEHCRPVPRPHNGRYGWTEFQMKHSGLVKAWLQPALPCFELDRLPLEPWRSLAARYCAEGWSRPWDPYPDDAADLWSWWLATAEAAA